MFFVFVLIAGISFGGVIFGVLSFFGQGYEFREAEASQLAQLVKECFMKNDVDFFAEGFDISFECQLNKNVIESEHIIYISDKTSGREFVVGVGDYRNQCYFEGAQKNKNYPRCVSGIMTKDGFSYDYVVGSNQKGRKILS